MYKNSMADKIKDAITAREVVDVAGLPVDTALVTLNAVSEAQRNFGGDVRLYALASIWNTILPSYKTAQFSQALIAACNLHPEATFWIDNKNQTFAHLLGKEISAELKQ